MAGRGRTLAISGGDRRYALLVSVSWRGHQHAEDEVPQRGW